MMIVIVRNSLLYLLTFFILLIAGCSDDAETAESPAEFESTNISKGDSVGQFVVQEVQVNPAGSDNWSGYLIFGGTVEISGKYGKHPAYPDSGTVSFFPDEKSRSQLPRYVKDERNGWFTFSNEADDPLLTALRNPNTGYAKIVISEFFYTYGQSDVENSARLLDILQLDQDELQ
jgi:hypothetical protein